MADLKEQIEEHVPGTDGGADSVLSALKSKELLVPAALSAVSALVVAKAPDLMRRFGDATERKGEDMTAGLGEKAVEGAKQGLTSGREMLGKRSGLLEKTASGMSFVKRAVQADLARFKAYVELDDAPVIEYGPYDNSLEREANRRERAEARKVRRAAHAA